jgi:hypothetical protein
VPCDHWLRHVPARSQRGRSLSLLPQLRLPADSDERRLHNVELALAAFAEMMAEEGKEGKEGKEVKERKRAPGPARVALTKAEDVVNGNQLKTLGLIWNISEYRPCFGCTSCLRSCSYPLVWLCVAVLAWDVNGAISIQRLEAEITRITKFQKHVCPR